MRKRRGASPVVLAMLPILLLLSAAFWFALLFDPGLFGGMSITASPSAVRQVIHGAAQDIVDDLNHGRTQQADDMFQRTVTELRGLSDPYVDLAQEIVQGGRPADAARYLADAVKDSSVNWDPMLWATLADAQRKAGDREQAVQSDAQAERCADTVRRSVGQKPPTANAALADRISRLLLVGGYYSDKRHDAANDGVNDAVATQRDIDNALALFQEAVRIAPDNTPLAAAAMNAYGYTLADKGTTSDQFDQAIALTKKALAISPDDPEFLDSYGWALFKKNDLPDARRVLREAVDAAPDEPEIHYHLGVVYGQLGLIADARLELERALVVDPDLKDARDAEKRLRLPAGQGVLESA